jgi:hypothetical protein
MFLRDKPSSLEKEHSLKMQKEWFKKTWHFDNQLNYNKSLEVYQT